MADEAAPQKPELEEAKPGEVTLIDRAGRRVFVPQEDLSAAMADGARGFRQETPEEAKSRRQEALYGDQEGKAMLEGGARGLTFGLSDLALTKSGLVSSDALEGRKETSPVAAGIGEAAGIGVGLFAGPGALVAKGAGLGGKAVAAAVGEGLGAKLAGAAVTGAAEGSLYGIGNTVSEASLGNTDLNAQKLLAGAGLGAVMGGVGGVGGELFGLGARSGLKKLAEAADGLPAQLQDMAENRALKASGMTQADLQRIPEEQQKRIARRLLDQKLIPAGGKAEDVLEAITSDKAGSIKEARSLLEAADEAAPVGVRPDWESGPLPQGAQKKAGGFDVQRALDRINTELVEPMADNPIRMRAVQDALGDIRAIAEGGNVPFVKANQIKNDLGEGLFNGLDNKLKKRLSRQVEGIFNDELKTQVGEALGGNAEDALRAVQGNTADLIVAEKAARKGVNRELGNRAFSLTDHIAGGVGSVLGGPAGTVAGAVLNKVARERLPSALAVGLDSLAKAPWLRDAADAFSSFAKKQIEASGPSAFAEYTPLLASALARSPEEAFLTHATLSQRDPNYRNLMASNGLDYTEDPHAVVHRAQGLSIIKGHIDSHDAEVQSAFRDALNNKATSGGGTSRSPLLGDSATGPLKSLEARIAYLKQLAENPQALQDKLSGSLGPIQGLAPQLATAVAATAARAVDFLSAKAPQSPDPLQQVPALRRPWQPSEEEKSRFERYLAATADPHGILKQLGLGVVPREAVEALQAVYPELYGDWRQKAMSALATHPGSLDFQQRMALSRLLQAPLDATLQPERLAALQATHAAPAVGPNGGATPGNRPLKPGAPLADQSPSQAIEGRRQQQG